MIGYWITNAIIYISLYRVLEKCFAGIWISQQNRAIQILRWGFGKLPGGGQRVSDILSHLYWLLDMSGIVNKFTLLCCSYTFFRRSSSKHMPGLRGLRKVKRKFKKKTLEDSKHSTLCLFSLCLLPVHNMGLDLAW